MGIGREGGVHRVHSSSIRVLGRISTSQGKQYSTNTDYMRQKMIPLLAKFMWVRSGSKKGGKWMRRRDGVGEKRMRDGVGEKRRRDGVGEKRRRDGVGEKRRRDGEWGNRRKNRKVEMRENKGKNEKMKSRKRKEKNRI